MKTSFTEWLRCTKHNLLDRPWFKVFYRSGLYHVHTNDGVHLKFPHNPFQPFLEIWGYLKEGEWRLEAGMNVLDAGAYLGEFSLYAAARVGPAGRVFLMEPDPSNLKRLEEIFVINGGRPANLEVIGAGLWEESGSLEFAAGINGSSTLNIGSAEANERGSLHRLDEKISRANMLTVPVMSLPDLVHTYQLARLDFVKMDIEGAEVEAVEGAGFVLSRYKPKFAIASYHRRAGKRTADFLPPIFQASNYFVESGFPWHLTTYASPIPFPR
ncbi:MAG: FkbM family methyltransferase [Anaerolineaceae bacterium]|nr:MAG: FkbM family methyltransferase [Anaerolineaceae bacterium]